MNRAKPGKPPPPPPPKSSTTRSGKRPPPAKSYSPVEPPVTRAPPERTNRARLFGIPSHLKPIFQNTDQLLLYRAPSHTSFVIYAWLVGSVLILGAVNQGLLARDNFRAKRPWYVPTALATVALVMAGFATIMVTAPLKMIKSITLVAKQTSMARPILRFEMKSPMPFIIKGGTVEKPLNNEVFIDREVAAQQVHYRSIPLSQAQEFTTWYENVASTPRPSIRLRWRTFNQSLLNIWPSFKQDTRRMLLRDNMAHVRIDGHGSWKLDLYDCEMLDDGRPLAQVISFDEGYSRGFAGWLRNFAK